LEGVLIRKIVLFTVVLVAIFAAMLNVVKKVDVNVLLE